MKTDTAKAIGTVAVWISCGVVAVVLGSVAPLFFAFIGTLAIWQ